MYDTEYTKHSIHKDTSSFKLPRIILTFIGQCHVIIFTYNLDLGKHLQLFFPGQHRS